MDAYRALRNIGLISVLTVGASSFAFGNDSAKATAAGDNPSNSQPAKAQSTIQGDTLVNCLESRCEIDKPGINVTYNNNGQEASAYITFKYGSHLNSLVVDSVEHVSGPQGNFENLQIKGRPLVVDTSSVQAIEPSAQVKVRRFEEGKRTKWQAQNYTLSSVDPSLDDLFGKDRVATPEEIAHAREGFHLYGINANGCSVLLPIDVNNGAITTTKETIVNLAADERQRLQTEIDKYKGRGDLTLVVNQLNTRISDLERENAQLQTFGRPHEKFRISAAYLNGDGSYTLRDSNQLQRAQITADSDNSVSGYKLSFEMMLKHAYIAVMADSLKGSKGDYTGDFNIQGMPVGSFKGVQSFSVDEYRLRAGYPFELRERDSSRIVIVPYAEYAQRKDGLSGNITVTAPDGGKSDEKIDLDLKTTMYGAGAVFQIDHLSKKGRLLGFEIDGTFYKVSDNSDRDGTAYRVGTSIEAELTKHFLLGGEFSYFSANSDGQGMSLDTTDLEYALNVGYGFGRDNKFSILVGPYKREINFTHDQAEVGRQFDETIKANGIRFSFSYKPGKASSSTTSTHQ